MMLGANPPMLHPGPMAERRRDIAASRAEEFAVPIAAGTPVEAAVRAAFADAGFQSGCVLIDGLDCDPFRYVIPAPPIDAARLAWYSEVYAPEGRCRIEQGYMSVGRDDGAFFTHCHGIWRLADGQRAIGHLLANDTVAAAPCELRAIGFHDAHFERRADAETGFSLFAALPGDAPSASSTPSVIVVTLRPNEDISLAVEEICVTFGIGKAQIHGLGSLNGAAFTEGERMEAAVTEFLIRAGRYSADSGAWIDIAAVDADGGLYDGVVLRGRATVSITAELVIVAD